MNTLFYNNIIAPLQNIAQSIALPYNTPPSPYTPACAKNTKSNTIFLTDIYTILKKYRAYYAIPQQHITTTFSTQATHVYNTVPHNALKKHQTPKASH